MEWVETTGRSVEEATDAALDQLGVAEEDAEVIVLEEPRPGLFGRVRGEARVRARVRPTQPRPKEDRRDRRRRRQGERTRTGADGAGGGGGAAGEGAGDEDGADETAPDQVVAGEPEPETAAARRGGGGRSGRSRSGGRAAGDRSEDEDEAPSGLGDSEESTVESDVSLEEQGAEAAEFLSGLLERMNLSGEVSVENVDEDTVEVRVTGGELGILIGPRGNTLSAVQELTRTVVQRQLGAHNGRLLVDVAGYRQKRKVALERFTQEVAAEVRSSGQRRVLEPMSAADRKIVHDTANGIDGVSTTSEGEEPRRRVVILPEG